MACNTWEKLSKAQRDYTKPKFAVIFVDKSLKKNPKNPFLLSWKADLYLQLNQEPQAAVSQLQQACEQSGLSDTRLLSYIYRLLLEATQKAQDRDQTISSVGNQGLDIWANAAKPLRRKEERQQLWSELAGNALREECWGDFRYAVMNYNKENATTKKNSYFTQVFAFQVSADQMSLSGKDDRSSQTQLMMALRMIKKAYEAPPDDAIAFNSIKDLRFMAKIYAKQHKHAELMQLWRNPPSSLQDLMAKHKHDLDTVLIDILTHNEDWPLLEEHCTALINDVLSQMEADPNSKALWEICAWRCHIWTNFMVSVSHNHNATETEKIVSDITRRAFGTELRTRDRFLRLVYMQLRRFIGKPMLSDCKIYWEHHSSLVTCFSDLRTFLLGLSSGEVVDFYDFMRSRVMDDFDSLSSHEGSHDAWAISEQNLLKIEYLLAIARPTQPLIKTFNHMITVSLGFCEMFPDRFSEGAIAIYSLLNFHHQIVCRDEMRNPLEFTLNSRVLLQATMFARHLVACDKEKQNRPLALLAARLHLNLGLGKSAFRLYNHVKCKEMLVDTLAPYVLSRISLTHPFEVKGYQGFSAEEELTKAISTIERMEQKTNNIIYRDMDSFSWDQAQSLFETQRKLKSSLTKHLCVTERRRIARLKGETIDNLPVLDSKTYRKISDNVDKKCFPHFEPPDVGGVLPFIMPNAVPNVKWFIESHDDWNACSRYLYKEGPLEERFDAWEKRADISDLSKLADAKLTRAEEKIQPMWNCIRCIVDELAQQCDHEERTTPTAVVLKEDVQIMRKAMENLRMPKSTGLKPVDEPAMFHENMLLWCYTQLEVIRALNKLVEQLREKVVNAKTRHPLKAKLPKNWVDETESENKLWYQSIRDVADSYIHLLKTTGEAAIRAQVRWGITGEKLGKLLDDDDVKFYAAEYVESALHAWKGVLEVKLK